MRKFLDFGRSLGVVLAQGSLPYSNISGLILKRSEFDRVI
jgi:hypothetical protein